MSDVIVAENLTRRFGDFTAVDRISFRVHQGDVVGYLGPNGSGKTTTIRMLLGLLLPSDGRASVLGYDIVRQSELVRANVGYMSQKFALYHDLTVRENLEFYAGVYGVRDKARLDEVLDLIDLQPVARERVGTLSTGWRQRLSLGTAIVHSPRLLFLDEPTSGVDPTARRAFWDLIYTLVDDGVTALVTTHYMDEAEYCGVVGILRDGRLLAMDTPSRLKESALPGIAWDVTPQGGPQSDLLVALEALAADPGVLQAGLAGDHLRAITIEEIDIENLKVSLQDVGLPEVRFERVEATLEDVFLALSGRGDDS